ncbi:MAG: ATP synthase subunit I [Xenophilus sp.]
MHNNSARSRTAGKAGDPDDSDFVPMTREQAQSWRRRRPQASPWRVVAAQVVVGGLAALVGWGWTGREGAGWSALYGALTAALPAALFVRGLKGRFSSLNAGTAVAAFFVWEMVKLAVTVVMLIAAPRLVPGLSWLWLLAGLLAALKMYWVASALAPRKRST